MAEQVAVNEVGQVTQDEALIPAITLSMDDQKTIASFSCQQETLPLEQTDDDDGEEDGVGDELGTKCAEAESNGSGSQQDSEDKEEPTLGVPAEREASAQGNAVEERDGSCVSKSPQPVQSNPSVQSTSPWKDPLGRSVSLPPSLDSPFKSKRKGSLFNIKMGRRDNADKGSSLFKTTTSTVLGEHYLERPSELPPKSKREEKKHKKDVAKLMKKADRKEKQELQEEKKKWERDDTVADHQLTWKEDILPNWERRHNTKEVQKLWEKGLPPSIRGQVWFKAIGNRLGLSEATFQRSVKQCHQKLGEKYSDDSASVQAIQLDILRTFPTLGFFQKGCAMHQQLHDVLGAYACLRPDLGYVQGMSFLAAVLLLNMDSFCSFTSLANLLAQPCYSVFFRVDSYLMQPYFDVFTLFLKEELKSIYLHFERLDVLPHYYLMEWVITMYTKCLPLDVACTVWDLYCRDGESFLFRVGLGLLRMYKSKILELEVLEDCGRFLAHFPDDISSDKLLKHTMSLELTDKRFQQRMHQLQQQRTPPLTHS